MDFGAPSQTKVLFKVYVTYKGNAAGLKVSYLTDGDTDVNDVKHFATDELHGTQDLTPLDYKGSTEDLEHFHSATLYPDTLSEGKDWKSIALYFNGSVDENFEINDIAILYRMRPIK